MNKNELIHLHSLLLEVAEEYVEEGVASPTSFEEYVDLGVTPRSLREPRASHERAVLVLARLLADATRQYDGVEHDPTRTRLVTNNH